MIELYEWTPFVHCVLVNKRIVGGIVMQVDGYYEFYPNRDAAFSAALLLEIGQTILKLNEDWDKRVQEVCSEGWR